MNHRLLVAVEGSGDEISVGNLIARLWRDLDLPSGVYPFARRFPGLGSTDGVERVATWARAETSVAGLLLLADVDDNCPARTGPATAGLLAAQNLPFPAAAVLLKREFESLFLASLSSIAGRPIGKGPTQRPGVAQNATLRRSPEDVRGVKEWLSSHFPAGKRYKPTVDQLDLMRLVDFDLVRASGHDSFRVLERALGFLAHGHGVGAVYPCPAPAGSCAP